MVGVLRRMHALREKILWIRHGPGAAVLPPNVTRIHLEFAKRINGGHMGPRKFWQENLPRLKFWNPQVPMIVNRCDDTERPATLTLYFRDDGAPAKIEGTQLSSAADGTSTAPAPSQGERTVVLDIKGLHSEKILEEFMAKTSATNVQLTPQEEMELRELEDLRKRGEIDRKVTKKMIDEKKREKARLALAMSEAAANKASAL
ncbi:CI-B8 domain-containing protein [Cercophora newfieldiana]|uniref:CI-B8 domain-containing protein n=1 Tax=Cercophora newfieldiana TaxID=92897 RepID=A0AA40CHS1_9PEZI|nr:CI-B8 domain-containing protein [Cercophora newfieldiana]